MLLLARVFIAVFVEGSCHGAIVKGKIFRYHVDAFKFNNNRCKIIQFSAKLT